MKTFYKNNISKQLLNNQITTLTKFYNQLYDQQEKITAHRLLNQQVNQVSFYQITPKKDLPKNLQKMSFQSLNTKQMNGTSIIKVYRKEPLTWKQNQIRKKLKQNGQILMLSQIYNYFDDDLQSKIVKQHQFNDPIIPLSNVINQLDQWEKNISKKNCAETGVSKLKLPSLRNTDDTKNIISTKKQQQIKKFKIGSNYSQQIIKNLQLINNCHNPQLNIIQRYTQIQINSKLLKKQLEQLKQFIIKSISDQNLQLISIRKQHHQLFQRKQQLYLHQQEFCDQFKNIHEQNDILNMSYQHDNQDESLKNEIQANQQKISKIKKSIQQLQNHQYQNQQQLKNILQAQQTYYKTSLKHGYDCRQTGLVWLIKKLSLQNQDMIQIQFPSYLDKKCKIYLYLKSKNQDILNLLLNNKKQFVRQIGGQRSCSSRERRTSIRKSQTKKSIKLEKTSCKSEQFDGIKQTYLQKSDVNDIPKRYNRSMKKITALRLQCLQDQNLLKYTHLRNGIKLGIDLLGLTGIQIYRNISQKIKKVDFTKLKKQKIQDKNDIISQYQNILKKIQNLHIQMQQQDLQHQNYLLIQYKNNKKLFFILAAACFGIKRAKTLIIKYFSWKNSI